MLISSVIIFFVIVISLCSIRSPQIECLEPELSTPQIECLESELSVRRIFPFSQSGRVSEKAYILCDYYHCYTVF